MAMFFIYEPGTPPSTPLFVQVCYHYKDHVTRWVSACAHVVRMQQTTLAYITAVRQQNGQLLRQLFVGFTGQFRFVLRPAVLL